MNPLRRAIVASSMLGASAVAAEFITPRVLLAAALPKLDLEATIPRQFGDWQIDESAVSGVVNPQQLELLNKLYSQTLSRTYMDRTGRRVMLSIAYGEDQRDGLAAHYPEVCYPAQGFQVQSNQVSSVQTQRGSLPVRRLETIYNAQRYEPVTYWMMIGETSHLGGLPKRLAEMKIGLKGFIADGLLVRVSSIGRNTSEQFALQDQFIDRLLFALPPTSLRRFSGLSAADALSG